MKKLDYIWNEFVYGGHFLSLGASAIALFTMMILNIIIRWEFLLIAYLGTQCIYNYNHYKELVIDDKFNSDTARYLKNFFNVSPYIIFFYGIFYFFLLLIFGSTMSIFFGGFLLLLGLVYTRKIKKASGRVTGFKSVYIAFSWALLIPFTAIYASYSLNETIAIMFIFLFLRFLVDTIFYDIKDMKSDLKEGISTLPIILGQNRCLTFLHILNFISLIPIIVGIILQLFPIYSMFFLIIFFYNFYYIQRAKGKKANIRSISYTFCDGEYNYWPFLLFIGKIIFERIL